MSKWIVFVPDGTLAENGKEATESGVKVGDVVRLGWEPRKKGLVVDVSNLEAGRLDVTWDDDPGLIHHVFLYDLQIKR